VYASIIFAEAERLKRQLETVLSVSAADKDFLQLYFEPTDVHEQLTTVASLFENKVHEFSGSVTLALAAQQHFCLVDRIHFGNVLYNLLDNAVKYSNRDNIAIRVETANIGNMLQVRISDKGRGINKDDLHRIFDMFYRDESNMSGFGVGLHYAKKIAGMHQGNISVESKAGEGTTVTLTIPIHTAHHDKDTHNRRRPEPR
jgi:signal transduction histidine kinase